MAQKQEIKAGTVVILTKEQNKVLLSLVRSNEAPKRALSLFAEMLERSNEELFESVFEIFPALKEFHLSVGKEKNKVIILVKSKILPDKK